MEPERFSPSTPTNTTLPANQLALPLQPNPRVLPRPGGLLLNPEGSAGPTTGQQAYLSHVQNDSYTRRAGYVSELDAGPSVTIGSTGSTGVVRPPQMPELYMSGQTYPVSPPQPQQPDAAGSGWSAPPQHIFVAAPLPAQPTVPIPPAPANSTEYVAVAPVPDDTVANLEAPPSFPYRGKPLVAPIVTVKEGIDSSWLDADGRNEHPLLQPGAGLSATADFCLGLISAQGGTYDEFATFVGAHFEEAGRFQLLLPPETGSALYNIPATSLPRFFDALTSAGVVRQALYVQSPTESTIWSAPQSPMSASNEPQPAANSQPRHGIKVEEMNMRWTMESDPYGALEWQGRLVADWVPALEEGALRLEKLEIEVEDWTAYGEMESVVEDALPPEARRMLQLGMEMEEMEGLIGLAERAGITPREALGIITDLDGPDDVRIITADGQEQDEEEDSLL